MPSLLSHSSLEKMIVSYKKNIKTAEKKIRKNRKKDGLKKVKKWKKKILIQKRQNKKYV